MTEGRVITGRTVLFGMLAFFGVIFAVNGAFVYFALESFPGLGTEDAYRKGLAYNDVLSEAKEQSKLGWKSRLTIGPASGAVREVTFELTDRDGNALPGLTVDISLERPVDELHDRSLALAQGPDGAYRATADLPMPGRWNAQVSVRDRGNLRYRADYALTVKP